MCIRYWRFDKERPKVRLTEAGSSEEWRPEILANVASSLMKGGPRFDDRLPDVPTNGYRRFRQTATGDSNKQLLEVPMNGGPRFNKWRPKVRCTVEEGPMNIRHALQVVIV